MWLIEKIEEGGNFEYGFQYRNDKYEFVWFLTLPLPWLFYGRYRSYGDQYSIGERVLTLNIGFRYFKDIKKSVFHFRFFKVPIGKQERGSQYVRRINN